MTKWDRRFLEMAQLISGWSKDPSTKCGAVIVDDKRRVVSHGYNGFARGVRDDESRYENRDVKYRMVVHAERNALLFAHRDLDDCTLYTWPIMPCAACAAMVIQAGIKRCVAPRFAPERWKEEFKLAGVQFYEAGVILDLVDWES